VDKGALAPCPPPLDIVVRNGGHANALPARRSCIFDFLEADQAVLSVGQISENVSSPPAKNIPLNISENQK
jgi:hypothetical protein